MAFLQVVMPHQDSKTVDDRHYRYSLEHAAQWLGLSCGGVLRLLRVFSMRIDASGYPVLEAWSLARGVLNKRHLVKALRVEYSKISCKSAGFSTKPAYASHQLNTHLSLNKKSSERLQREPLQSSTYEMSENAAEFPIFRPEALELLWLLKSGLAQGSSLSMLRAVLAQQTILYPNALRTPEAFRSMFALKPFDFKTLLSAEEQVVTVLPTPPAWSSPHLFNQEDQLFLDSLAPSRRQTDWLLPDVTPSVNSLYDRDPSWHNTSAISVHDFKTPNAPEDEPASMFGWLLKRLSTQKPSSQDGLTDSGRIDTPPQQVSFSALKATGSFVTPENRSANVAWSPEELNAEARLVREAFLKA